jgi:cation diffusion facilitator CzcD-associated flavoprotein CzcO
MTASNEAATPPVPSAAVSTTPRDAAWPSSGHVRIAVVGAGFGGLGMAHALREAGIEDFVVLDRGDTVGGTWRDNTYPGCGCDVASHLYSFSWAPNPNWSRSYSRQPEILAYLEDVARRFDLLRHVVLGVEVGNSRWDEQRALWVLETSRGPLTADILIGAGGPLSAPSTPNLPGLSEFPGPAFHSAQWRHDVDLTGKRVGLVGTGASAVQIVPEIQPKVGRLTLFQRTPPWVIPKGDHRLSNAEHTLYRRFPKLTKVPRAGNYLFREASVPAFVLQPALMRLGELVSRQMIKRQVSDPKLRELVTPDYRLGCKRVLPANEYYPALGQFNVHLVPHAVTGFEGSTAIAADGSRHELDVVILGTGFHVTDLPIGEHAFGRDGRSMNEFWREHGQSGLRGTTANGFPNLFLVLGPNSGLGHSSMIYIIESQVRYVTEAIAAMTVARLAAIEPRDDVQRRYNKTLQRRMKRTVWATGGCSSWYQNDQGQVTALWPGSTLRFRHDTKNVDLREYDVRPLDPAVGQARAAAAADDALTVTGNQGAR